MSKNMVAFRDTKILSDMSILGKILRNQDSQIRETKIFSIRVEVLKRMEVWDGELLLKK